MSDDAVPDNELSWNEGDTPDLTVYLIDRDGDPIPVANILTLNLSQWIAQGLGQPGISINSRKLQNALNANNVTVHSTSGLVTWQLQTADSAMQSKDTTVDEETHNYRFDITYTAGSATIAKSWPGHYIVRRKQVVR
jgi:hypothetical protein